MSTDTVACTRCGHPLPTPDTNGPIPAWLAACPDPIACAKRVADQQHAETLRLILNTARALHTAGYRRPQPAATTSTGGRVRELTAQLDTTHHIEFEPAPRAFPDQARLSVRHGRQQIVWDGVGDIRDAITLLATLGVIGTCRQCDLPIEADAVECGACAVTTDAIAYERAVDDGHGRHAAHEAA